MHSRKRGNSTLDQAMRRRDRVRRLRSGAICLFVLSVLALVELFFPYGTIWVPWSYRDRMAEPAVVSVETPIIPYVISAVTAFVSFAGLVSTTIHLRRTERRQAAGAALDLEYKRLQIEQLRRNLEGDEEPGGGAEDDDASRQP